MCRDILTPIANENFILAITGGTVSALQPFYIFAYITRNNSALVIARGEAPCKPCAYPDHRMGSSLEDLLTFAAE